MSRAGGPKTKNWTTNNSRNGSVSHVAGGLLFRFWVTLTNRDESDWTSDDALCSRSILPSFNQSDLISLLLDPQVADSLV